MSRRTWQFLLLCALTLSVIGMHHVPLSPHCTPHASMSAGTHAGATAEATVPAVTTVPAAHPGSGPGHDMLHLCLAVRGTASGLLILAWLLLAVGTGAATLAATRLLWTRRVWRPPGTAGRSLLTSLCVMRT